MASIMVVDDDPDVLDTIGAILMRAGHSIAHAAGGQEALTMLDAGGSPDLLLTDVVMPGLNGFNLARLVRERHPSIKVLYLTGYWQTPDVMRDAGERYGSLLTKPIMPHELRRAVDEALAGG